jgi:hypothetical protein
MPSAIDPPIMTVDERATLEMHARARAGRADLAQRARVMQLLAGGIVCRDHGAGRLEPRDDREVETPLRS